MIETSVLKASVLANIETQESDAERFKVVESLADAQNELLLLLSNEYLYNKNERAYPLIYCAIKNVSSDLSQSVSAYQYPSDYINMINVWINSHEAIIRRPGQARNVLSLDRQPTSYYPVVTLDRERGYKVAPTPIADIANGIELQYVYRLPTISDTQNSMLDLQLKNLLVFRATTMAASVENQKEKVAQTFAGHWANEWAILLGRSQ